MAKEESDALQQRNKNYINIANYMAKTKSFSLTNVLLALLGVEAVIVFVMLLVISSGSFGPASTTLLSRVVPKTSKATNQPTVTQQDVKGIMTAFPADFPLEEGASVTQSYKYLPPHSQQQQATLEYVSQKTLAQNSKLFAAYFTKDGYQMLNKISQPNFWFLYGTLDNNDLSVTVAKKGSQVLVSASFLRR